MELELESNQEQPKDYEVPTFEEFLDQEYRNLNTLEKITYRLQDHIWKIISISIAGGYVAGAYFGKFW